MGVSSPGGESINWHVLFEDTLRTHEDLKQAVRCFYNKIHGETSTKHTV